MCCFYKRKIWILFGFVLFVNVLFAQKNKAIQNSKVVNDSTKQEIYNNKISLFNSDMNSKSPLLMLGKHYDPYLETFNFIVPENIFENKKFGKFNYYDRERIKNEINQAMKVYREGQLKNDLGFVGQILGYSETAAAVGLAIYHIHKYGFK